MNGKKMIAVVGATGARGGGLVRAILADRSGPFTARAITRKTDSDKARALAALGAEVVAGDADDPASLDRAFAGCHGAFCVTNFWEHFSVDREGAQATAMARASRKAGLQHVVWSTLEDSRTAVPLDDARLPTLQGRYKVPHFDSKGQVDRVFAAEAAPTSYVLAAFYWENFIHFGMGPKAGPDGTLALTLPIGDKKMPGIASGDIGKCALGIFAKGRETIGTTIGIAGEHLTGAQMAAAFGRALGRTVRYNEVTPEAYRSFGFPGADDLGNMFQFKRDFESIFCGARDPAVARALNPDLLSFDRWLDLHKSQIPLQ